ncbi:MAG TPA: hypothetical protein VHB27_03720 [Rhodopila sp.]|uniref:hypothetical protein n=1 Tax=Rhodopila sp. TaxID=2480087 RepID=UPI002B9FA29C|nr:hypothetical protein [Rhodopila sp.]HVY14310.1 hypothetical protein [Rhodopila sp.]
MNAKQSPSRALWAAVVLQAKDDLENAAFDSLDYQHAEAFFIGGGDWRHARAAIADQLDMDPDYLVAIGRKWVTLRRDREGVPLTVVQPAPRAPVQRPRPAARTATRLVFTPFVPPIPSVRPAGPRRPWRKGGPNPFSPFRQSA